MLIELAKVIPARVPVKDTLSKGIDQSVKYIMAIPLVHAHIIEMWSEYSAHLVNMMRLRSSEIW